MQCSQVSKDINRTEDVLVFASALQMATGLSMDSVVHMMSAQIKKLPCIIVADADTTNLGEKWKH